MIVITTYPRSSKISQEYDIAGRLSKFTNKRGQEIAYAYDSFGKLITKTTPEGEIGFTYDNRDRITEILGNDFHYRYSYGNFVTGWGMIFSSAIVKEEDVNSGNWLETFTNYYGLPYQTFDNFGWNKVFTYNFSTSPSTPVGPTPQNITYYKRYDGSGRSLAVHYAYDNGVRPAHKTNSRFDNEHFYYYDANGLMNGIYYRADIYHTGNYASGRLNFTRDQSGLISTITQDLAMTVNYDPDLQISSIAHTLPQPFDESYTYDDNGNRLTSLSNSFIYDDLNKLTESTTHDYTYDADGNMTSERNKLTGESKKYYWDSESRMIKYEHLASDISPVDTTALYKYDIYGRRIQKSVNDTITNFMWEGDNLSFELNASNQPIRKYFTEMGMDDYFAHLEYAEVTNWAYVLDASYRQGWYGYIKDQVGTIYKVWDHNARAIADNRTYDSFGNLVSQTGTTKTPLGLQGKYFDVESGLNYFYHRYYNPVIGRFITFDPLKLNSEINLFKFVRNNPLSIIDPLGLKPICVPWFSENTDWYFEKNPNLKDHVSVLVVGINPANYSTCIWKKETKGISTRLTRPQKLCFGVAVCGNIIPFVISAGDWKEESEETSEYEVIQTRGVSYASINNPKKMGGVWCQNPWPPFNWQYFQSPK